MFCYQFALQFLKFLFSFFFFFGTKEQLDGAGIELPSLYKWIESQAPTNCSTEAWQKRIHWIGSQVTCDFTESKAHAEEFLQTHRPVRRYVSVLLLLYCGSGSYDYNTD